MLSADPITIRVRSRFWVQARRLRFRTFRSITYSAVSGWAVDGKLKPNPSYDEIRDGQLSIMVAGTEEGIVMVEAGANQVSEEKVVEAIEFGHDCCKKITAGIRELMAKAGKSKRVYEPAKPESGEGQQDCRSCSH